MKFKFLNTALAGLILSASCLVTEANAGLIEVKWDTTVETSFNWAPTTTIGEAISIVITLDNGQSSALNQTWDKTNFVQFRIESASGWQFSSDSIYLRTSSGVFATDSSGNVTSAGSWKGFSSSVASWDAGLDAGKWYNNGVNSVAYNNDYSMGLSVTNVEGNLEGANWYVSSVQPSSNVPEPSTLAILALGMMGLASGRFKKQA